MYHLFPWHARYSTATFRCTEGVVTAEPSGRRDSYATFLVARPDASGKEEIVETSVYSLDIGSLRYDVRGFNGREFNALSRFDNEGMAWLEAALHALCRAGIDTTELRSRWTQTLRLSQEHCNAATRTDIDSGIAFYTLAALPGGFLIEKPCVYDAGGAQGMPCFTNGRSILYRLRQEADERISLLSSRSDKPMAIFEGPNRDAEAIRALATRPYLRSDLSGHETLNLYDATRRAEDLISSCGNDAGLLGIGGFIPNACPIENLRLALQP